MEVRKERVGDPTQAVSPSLVAEFRVDAETQNLGLCGIKVAQLRLDAGNLDASCRGKIKGIENQQHVLFAAVVRKLDCLAVLGLKREVRCVCTGFNDSHYFIPILVFSVAADHP